VKRRELHDHRRDLTRSSGLHRGHLLRTSPAQRTRQPTTQSPWFTAAATYFELDEIADLIGRLEPDDALSHEYWELSSPFGEDASLIRDALRCKIFEAPGDWV